MSENTKKNISTKLFFWTVDNQKKSKRRNLEKTIFQEKYIGKTQIKEVITYITVKFNRGIGTIRKKQTIWETMFFGG